MEGKTIAKVWFKNILERVQQLKSSRFLPVFLIIVSSGCSLEKELPSACVSSDKSVVRNLCRDYKSKIDESSKRLALIENGFNKRDAKAIYLHDEEQSVSCKRLISRQCGLIEIRNGVGY